MSLPKFNKTGDLPTGVHLASLADAIARFGVGSDQRKIVSSRLGRIYEIAAQTSFLARFAVFGSFVTDKRAPNDVEFS